MKLKRAAWLTIWGGLWAAGGISLLRKGLHLIAITDNLTSPKPLLKNAIKFIFSDEKATVALILVSVVLGIIKGRTLIAKAARRIMDKISVIDGPVSIKQAFDLRTLILMGAMTSLGFVLNIIKIPNDVRGVIDTTVGSALLQGSFSFFKGIFVKKVKEALHHK